MVDLDAWLRDASAQIVQLELHELALFSSLFVSLSLLIRCIVSLKIQGATLVEVLQPWKFSPPKRRDETLSGAPGQRWYHNFLRKKYFRLRAMGFGWEMFNVLICAFVLIMMVHGAARTLNSLNIRLTEFEQTVLAMSFLPPMVFGAFVAENTRRNRKNRGGLSVGMFVRAVWQPVTLLLAIATYPQLELAVRELVKYLSVALS